MSKMVGGVRSSVRSKIKSISQIATLVAAAKRSGKKVVTTNGCFDILHVGHTRSLEMAKSLGDVLVVGINSDNSARLNKGVGRPVNPAAERAEIISFLTPVDYVFIFDSKTPTEWIEAIKPSIHVKGKDRKMSEIVEKEAVEMNGGIVKLLPYIKKRSTTSIIKKIISDN